MGRNYCRQRQNIKSIYLKISQLYKQTRLFVIEVKSKIAFFFLLVICHLKVLVILQSPGGTKVLYCKTKFHIFILLTMFLLLFCKDYTDEWNIYTET